jgi:SAM-dependent methyltransferase
MDCRPSDVKVRSGIPSIREWKEIRQSSTFSEMERFSRDFLRKNSPELNPYSRKWVRDPLHQWSRIWEYPFVHDRLSTWRSQSRKEAFHVLDAGSGMTFFPYYLCERLASCRVTCCDTDETVHEIFQSIQSKMSLPVHFRKGDIQKLPFPDATFDAVYCISVLEHLKGVDEAISEIGRVVKTDGILVVTFDVSLDGSADISFSRAEQLVKRLRGLSLGDGPKGPTISEACASNDILTTTYVAQIDHRLLPWHTRRPSFVARLLRTKQQPTVYHNLAVFGEAYHILPYAARTIE